MDLDIEMDVDVDDIQGVPQIPEAYTLDIITGEEQEPGEVDEPLSGGDDYAQTDKAVVPNKVHVRGLDTFTPDDVKAYLAQHYSAGLIDRIEWIDDSAANLVFKSELVAQEALVALAALAIADATQLPPLETVPAKQYAAKPDSVLHIRFAVESDKKVAGAAQRSRFYLLHPEYDPEERRRRGDFGGRGKYRDRDDGYRRDHRNRRDGRRRDRRDEEEEPEPFDVSLYDDDAAALAQRTLGRRPRSRPRSRRNSVSSTSSTSDRNQPYSRRNRERELFPERRLGNGYRARARSASPARDRDGDADMDQDEDARAAAALRSREKGRSIKERLSKDNSAKDSGPRELFPQKDNRVKELFPTKVSSAVEGSRAQMDQVDDNTILASAKLADRITPRSTTPVSSAGGLNIRGLAAKRINDQGAGLAIKGSGGATVKELFPEKFSGNNAGKELFVEKLEGRGRRRQKAEDSFY